MKYKARNILAVFAYNRKAGIHTRSLNEPRGGQRNVQREYLDEYENDNDFDNEANERFFDCWD